MRETAVHAISLYYLGTIGFLLVDLMFGWNIRIAALEHAPLLKYGWYTGLIGCSLIIRLRPQRSALVALVEGSANLFLLLGGIMLTYYGAIDQALAGSFDGINLTPESMINACFSGLVIVGGIYGNPLMKGGPGADNGKQLQIQ
ncbi:hypothetical protein ACFL3H_02210 [Gemmatimonadota bacterium]